MSKAAAKVVEKAQSLRVELALSVSLIFGISLAVSGIYVLAGIGWAMLVASVPFILLSAVILRGMMRAG